MNVRVSKKRTSKKRIFDNKLTKDELLVEYKNNHDEIIRLTDKQYSMNASLATVAITIIIAIIEQESFVLSLIPLVLVIMISLRFYMIRRGIFRRCAYAIVFLEPHFQNIKFETRYFDYLLLRDNLMNRLKLRYGSQGFLESFIFGLISYGVFVYKYFLAYENINLFQLKWDEIIWIFSPLVILVIALLFIANKTDDIKDKRKFIQTWEKIKNTDTCHS